MIESPVKSSHESLSDPYQGELVLLVRLKVDGLLWCFEVLSDVISYCNRRILRMSSINVDVGEFLSGPVSLAFLSVRVLYRIFVTGALSRVTFW